tara:strand:+ start:36 stop:191 length:156 start_codon:yes stop_codon:yes gene_type:complete
MTRVNIEVESELHKKAKLAAVLESKTLIEFINEAIKEKVELLEKASAKNKK